MIDRALIKNNTPADIQYIDLSSLLGTWAGVIIRNDHISEDELLDKIGSFCQPEYPKSGVYRLIQKHTNRIVSARDDLQVPADGIFSNIPEDILVIRTADCIPLFLFDGTTSAVLHLGWRGIVGGIIANIPKSIPNLDFAKTRIVIGPGIGKCCFEVSPEVALIFNNIYRIKKEEKYYIDLESMVIDELKKTGFNNIYSLDACTYCESDIFYSYRREGEDVRHLLSYISPGGCE